VNEIKEIYKRVIIMQERGKQAKCLEVDQHVQCTYVVAFLWGGK